MTVVWRRNDDSIQIIAVHQGPVIRVDTFDAVLGGKLLSVFLVPTAYRYQMGTLVTLHQRNMEHACEPTGTY